MNALHSHNVGISNEVAWYGRARNTEVSATLIGISLNEEDERAAAGADHDDGAGIGAPRGLRLAHALDLAEGDLVPPFDRSIG